MSPSMEKQKYLPCIFLLLCLTAASGACETQGLPKLRQGNVKMFVFGDSYADTGNCPKSYAGSWNEPYGVTYPGKPAGRFSDGRVLTDYIASFVGIQSPLPYELRNSADKKSLASGMNFAYGGTGVFNTLVKEPNMTTQVNAFQQLLEEGKLFTKHDLNSSVALVSVGGNDYATYMTSNGTLEGLPDFTETVINQLTLNLMRIHSLGVKKIAVTSMEPLGCLPAITASSSYMNCGKRENALAEFHNQKLQQNVNKLNNQTGGGSTFTIIDLHGAFLSAWNRTQGNHTGASMFGNPLKPCFVGIAKGYSCGNVDQNGGKMYTVCEEPHHSFFWDMIHPSHQGLSFYTSEKTLRAAFETFGEIVEVKIIMDKISKRSKGFAFVEFTTEEAASVALHEMNGKIINGWMITVDVAKSNPPRYSKVRPGVGR